MKTKEDLRMDASDRRPVKTPHREIKRPKILSVLANLTIASK